MAEKRVHGRSKNVVQQPISLAPAAESGDHLSALKALRDRLARDLDECRSKRDIAALARQLSAVLAQIESWRPPRTSKLHRDHALSGGVVGPPDLAHAAAAQQLDQPVASERRPVHIGLLAAAVQQTISAPTRPDDEIEESDLSNGVRNDNVNAGPSSSRAGTFGSRGMREPRIGTVQDLRISSSFAGWQA